MKDYYLISDAAKKVQVESHVLRYWEEELSLPIRRNDFGHRYYTREDIECFQQIKNMKKRGLQLKAIKMILKDGKLDLLEEKEKENQEDAIMPRLGMEIRDTKEIENQETREDEGRESDELAHLSKEEKAKRLQWILQQMIRETMVETNREFGKELRESIIKELDYQFRSREDKDEERMKLLEARDELYYQKMDELLRKRSKGFKKPVMKPEDVPLPKVTSGNTENSEIVENEEGHSEKKTEKKKRHFIF